MTNSVIQKIRVQYPNLQPHSLQRSIVQLKQLLESPEYYESIIALLDIPAATMAFHDPTGVASWHIDVQTNTLTCWGNNAAASGASTVYTFPKTFARVPTVTATSGTEMGGGVYNHTVTVPVGTITTAQFAITGRQGTVTSGAYDFQWHATGEWSGA